METTWTAELESKIREGSSRTASGSSCCFMQLTAETGLKLYATKLERDASYVALGFAADHGLAPRVGQCIELDCPIPGLQRPVWWPQRFEPKKLYGFLTEIVDCRPCDHYESRKLSNDLEALFGFVIRDLDGGNIGFTNDGRLVALDIDGRFSGLMTSKDIQDVNKAWGGGFW